MRSLNRSFIFGGSLVALAALGCGAGTSKDTDPRTLDVGPTDDTLSSIDVSGDGSTDGPTLTDLTVDPSNGTIYIDTATGVGVPAVLTYKIILNKPDGTKQDVSTTATMTIDDPTLGTFAGPTFTSIDKLPGTGTVVGVTTKVHATTGAKSGLANLTIVQLRKTGDKRDFFFLVPYNGEPSPTRDVLKFGTNIKQVDVAVIMDTTGSMGGSITNLKTNISTTMFPGLVKAIPSVGMSVVYHDDYPTGSYGSPGCGSVLPGDLPVGVVQVITTDLKKAQDAANKLETHCGADGPEAQLCAQYHVLTGKALDWPGGSVPKHTPKTGTFGGVDFRPGSLPVVVEITDVNWHDDYTFPHPTMVDLKKAYSDNNAKFVDVTAGPEDQANDLSDATKSNIAPAAFGSKCGAGQCCTGMSGAGRAPTGPKGTCRLNFLHSGGTGVSDQIVKAIQAISVGSVFDVTAKASNDPANPDGVDATQFIKALRAMAEGDVANGCPAATTKDTDGDTIDDTFVGVKVGTPVCFEVLPKMNTTVKPKDAAQFFNAFIDVLGMPGSVKLDQRTVLFLVPPTEIIAK
jgi:hypothetical protein